MVVAGAFYPNYFAQGEMDEELIARDLCGHDPKTTVMVGQFGMETVLKPEK